MTSQGRSGLPGPPGPPSPGPGARIIPLQPGTARPVGERRALMRDAVVQVVRHLVVQTMPPGARSAMFDQAADLLDLAGWGLDELFEASQEGPARDELMRRLGLLD